MTTKPQRARITVREVWLVIGNVLIAGALVLATWKLGPMIAWVVLGLFVALAFEPAVRWLTEHRWKRGWAVFTVFFAAFLLFGGLIALLVPMLITQGRELVAGLPDMIDRIRSFGPIHWADQQLNLTEKLREGAGDQAGNVAQPALAFAGGVVHTVAGAITIVVLAIFFLMFGEAVFDNALEWLAPRRRDHAKALAVRMSKVVSGYVAGTAIIASIGGVVMGVTMAILGVPYFLPLGLLMIVLGVIPVIGTSIAAIAIVGATFATAGSTAGFVCAGVYLAYQQVENHVLQPAVQTRTLKMNPLLIVIALIVGTGLLGVLGALIALPIAGALQVLAQDILARRRQPSVPEGA